MKRTLMGMALALLILVSACSGDGNGNDGPGESVSAEDSPLFDDEANAPIEQVDTASGGVISGPIDGLLTIQPSFGFGAYAVDSRTGQAAAVPGIAAVESVDRNNDVIVSGNAAYALGLKTRDGQSFSFDVSIVKFEYDTGQVRQLAALGFDRETDDSSESTSYRLIAVAGKSVVVSTGSFSGDDTIYTVYDAETGATTASFEAPSYSFSSDAGSCSGGVSQLLGLSDGRLIGTSLNSPALVDIDSGEVELMIPCDGDEPQLSEYVSVADVNDYAVFSLASSPSDEELEQLLMTDLEPEQGFVEGDGDLWWINAANRTVNGSSAIVGGVVQFDLATQAVQAVHPLGEHLGTYLDCEPQGDTCELETIGQADMRYIDGRLVIVDVNENGQLLVLDPATSELQSTTIDPRGVDYTTANILGGDRNAVWLEVRRMTVVSDDENGRSSAGESYLELVDPATGAISLSLAGEDLFS